MIRITEENYKDFEKNHPILLLNLLSDVEKINVNLVNKGYPNRTLEIWVEDKHTEYSPERVDPCPDYYGCYAIRKKNSNECIGEYLANIHELDTALFYITEFFNQVILNKY